MEFLDPRRRLGARIIWIFGAISLAASMLASIVAGTASRHAIERDIGKLYADRAGGISDAIDLKLISGMTAVKLLARSMTAAPPQLDRQEAERLSNLLDDVIDDVSWAGITDISGTVIAGSGGRHVGESFADRFWFQSALNGSTVGPLEHIATASHVAADSLHHRDPRLVPVAVPVPGEAAPSGLLVAYFDVGSFYHDWLQANPGLTEERNAEVLVFAADGQRILEEGQTSDDKDRVTYAEFLTTVRDAGDEQSQGALVTASHLLGYARSIAVPGFPGTGWTVIVREPLSSAYAPASRLALLLAIAGLLTGLGICAVSAVLSWKLTQRLTAIANAADALKTGATSEFTPLSGQDEVARISLSLAALINSLNYSNHELLTLNHELDSKVIERTHEVQRLSEETRIAAITRERFRMSRDLHDTLAHTMLAMLTQIRLIRKIARARPERLDEELARAEQAAEDGLAKARAAVTDLRYIAVRDDGLGAALAKLVARLKERVEIESSLEVAEAAAALSGPKAETLYRIAEEALHNIEKHAQASHVAITVELAGQAHDPPLSLLIFDDGKGFDPAKAVKGKYGLLGMREQAELMGGSLKIDSAPAKGTSIRFEVTL